MQPVAAAHLRTDACRFTRLLELSCSVCEASHTRCHRRPKGPPVASALHVSTATVRRLLVALLALAALLQPGIARAGGGDDLGGGGGADAKGTGNFAVTVNGRVYDPASGRE